MVAASSARPSSDRQHKLKQSLLKVRRNVTYHPQVQQGNPPIIGKENVAGVRISMEKAVNKDLLQIRPEYLIGKFGPVDFHGGQRTE